MPGLLCTGRIRPGAGTSDLRPKWHYLQCTTFDQHCTIQGIGNRGDIWDTTQEVLKLQLLYLSPFRLPSCTATMTSYQHNTSFHGGRRFTGESTHCHILWARFPFRILGMKHLYPLNSCFESLNHQSHWIVSELNIGCWSIRTKNLLY